MPQRPKQARADAPKYALSFTPRAWDNAVQRYSRCGDSMYNTQLIDLLHAVCKAHHGQPGIRQVHFGLYRRSRTGRRAKQPCLELTLDLVDTGPEAPHLQVSLKGERVDS